MRPPPRAASLERSRPASPPSRTVSRRARRTRARRSSRGSPTSSSVLSHWLSRICAKPPARESTIRESEALSEYRVAAQLVKRRSQVCDPATAGPAGVLLLLGDKTAGGQEGLLQRADRSGQGEMQHDQRRQQRRPQPPRLLWRAATGRRVRRRRASRLRCETRSPCSRARARGRRRASASAGRAGTGRAPVARASRVPRPSAIGCCADAATRSRAPRSSRSGASLSWRNGSTPDRLLNGL